MDQETANKVARLMGYADHACSTCVRDLAERAEKLFPGWTFTLGDEIEEYDDDWNRENEISTRRIEVIAKLKD